MKTTTIQTSLRILLGVFMTFAGIGHLTFQRHEFLAQVPGWLPHDPVFMDFVVLSSGLVEISLGLSMVFWVRHKIKVGILLALFYVLIFPGNISQYTNAVDGFGLDTDQKRLIRLFFQPVLIFWALWSTGAYKFLVHKIRSRETLRGKTFYDFEAIDIRGNVVSMKDYRNKTVVVVNTASKCGLTPQYEGLEKLYTKYSAKGLVILGFPCNQFAAQEPGSSEEIAEFCQINYGVSFPIFSKIDVNGDHTHPLFVYLKMSLSGWFGDDIKWNFTKFVINKNGKPVKRFSPVTKPENMEDFLKECLL